MMDEKERSTYQSYLLRLWRDSPQSSWQASLQSTETEKVYQFAGVEQMWAFLMAHLGGELDDAETGAAPPAGLEGPEK